MFVWLLLIKEVSTHRIQVVESIFYKGRWGWNLTENCCPMIRSNHVVGFCLAYLLFSFFLYLQARMQKFCTTWRLLNLWGLNGEDEQAQMESIAKVHAGRWGCVFLLLLQCTVNCHLQAPTIRWWSDFLRVVFFCLFIWFLKGNLLYKGSHDLEKGSIPRLWSEACKWICNVGRCHCRIMEVFNWFHHGVSKWTWEQRMTLWNLTRR